jgi:hypothetical protein
MPNFKLLLHNCKFVYRMGPSPLKVFCPSSRFFHVSLIARFVCAENSHDKLSAADVHLSFLPPFKICEKTLT